LYIESKKSRLFYAGRDTGPGFSINGSCIPNFTCRTIPSVHRSVPARLILCRNETHEICLASRQPFGQWCVFWKGWTTTGKESWAR